MAGAAAGCGVRRAECARDHSGHLGSLQGSPLTLRDPERVLARRGGRQAGPRPLSRCGACALSASARTAGAGRLQPGHHDGPACRLAAAAPRRPASSASLACSPGPSTSPRRPRPPILLIHGETDDLIPVDAIHIAPRGAGRAGAPWSGISARAWATASIRTARALPAPYRRVALRAAKGRCEDISRFFDRAGASASHPDTHR